jgi:hypothetical protein
MIKGKGRISWMELEKGYQPLQQLNQSKRGNQKNLKTLING